MTIWQDVNTYVSKYGKEKFKRYFEETFPMYPNLVITNLINVFFFICLLGSCKEKFNLLCDNGFLLTTTEEISRALSIKKSDVIMSEKILMELGLFLVCKDNRLKKFICFPNAYKHNEIIVKLKSL